MIAIKIIQVVGYKDSGKTTLVVTLLKYLRKQGIKAASLKHHGHGGLPASSLEESDSFLHGQAGAIVAGVEGDGLFQLMKPDPWSLDELIGIYQLWNMDMLVIEGYKQADFDKIVMIRDEKDLHLLQELSNIVTAVTSMRLEQPISTFPAFRPDELERLSKWMVDHWYKRKEQA